MIVCGVWILWFGVSLVSMRCCDFGYALYGDTPSVCGLGLIVLFGYFWWLLIGWFDCVRGILGFQDGFFRCGFFGRRLLGQATVFVLHDCCLVVAVGFVEFGYGFVFCMVAILVGWYGFVLLVFSCVVMVRGYVLVCAWFTADGGIVCGCYLGVPVWWVLLVGLFACGLLAIRGCGLFICGDWFCCGFGWFIVDSVW